MPSAEPPTISPLDAFGPRSWERPEAVAFGREVAAATLRSPERSSLRDELSLDGSWDFVLRPRPDAVTWADVAGVVEPAAGWASVEVPGCWTMQGFDIPHYTNVQMPFGGPPPLVPAENPTGVHRRSVQIPASWSGQRIELHVGGAETVLYVHVDGRPVGMGKDSRLPHVFDLTDRVEPGTTAELALTVVRWSDATYLEDQDHWHHAGLHRSVRLVALPRVRIADVHVVADRDPATGDGHLRVDVHVEAPGEGPDGWQARVALSGAGDGDLAAESPVRWEHPTDSLHNWMMFDGRRNRFELDVPAVAPWSAEDPVLHPLAVELRDAAGDLVDEVALAVGFRRVEVVGHELLVNGEPVLIKGVNRHDHDARRGKAVTPEGIEADLVLMKQHNLNAVRTSHYPNDPLLYERCDQLGLYVVDEADLETHAYLRSLTKDPRWASAIGERVRRMVLRDKNHPSIICWSLGNESGISPALRAAAEWIRAFDPTRPIQYEGSIGEHLFGDFAAGTIPEMGELLARPKPESDLIAPMYPSVDDLVAWATRSPGPGRPLVMCEYIHAMGNSCGSLDRYWEAIRTYPGLQGGFVWDWVDQALVQQLPDGTERLAYGGDFGDEPNDGPFCCNGLVDAHRTPHPSLLELAKIVQPVQILAVDPARGVLRFTNERSFTDVSDLTATWTLLVDGLPVGSGPLDLPPLPPAASADVRVPLPAPLPPLAQGQVASLLVELALADRAPWAPAGHVVAWEQVEVARAAGPSVAPDAHRAGEAPALARFEPTLALFRAPIDNETFGPTIGERHADRWARLGLRAAVDRVALRTEESAGRVRHEVVVPDDLVDIARVGARLRLGPGIDRVEWLGDGPHEGATDRRCSTRLGRWTTLVDEWPVPYVHPQASGNRTGVRWLRFVRDDGTTALVVDELDDLQVTVARWTDEEVADATHLEGLPTRAERDECFVWIDAAHRGVGSAAVGPDVAPEHRVGPGTHRWSYRLR
jgi:beta-galactosidase